MDFGYRLVQLYPNKLNATADHFANIDVLSAFEQHGTSIATTQSNNGRMFCGRHNSHPYRALPLARGDRAPNGQGQASAVEPRRTIRSPSMLWTGINLNLSLAD